MGCSLYGWKALGVNFLNMFRMRGNKNDRYTKTAVQNSLADWFKAELLVDL